VQVLVLLVLSVTRIPQHQLLLLLLLLEQQQLAAPAAW
jgi:hypothetical protein